MDKGMDFERPYDPFGICFNTLKLRYANFDESLTSKNMFQKYDKINVFINLETCLKHLSMIADLEKKIMLNRDFNIMILSNILNLVAHYRKFFINNTFNTRVYLYGTDLESTEFEQFKYNEDYRSYYLSKYNENPKFVLLTDKMKQTILPDLKSMIEFLKGVYFISSKNIEGSLIPYVVAMKDTSRKNVIISGDSYDLQYNNIPGFVDYYIQRGNTGVRIYSSNSLYIEDLVKDNSGDKNRYVDMYKTYQYFCTLQSVLGDRIRSIDGLYGFGLATLQKYMEASVNSNIIQSSTTTPEIIGDIFHDGELKKTFVNNFYCTSILDMYNELTESDKNHILNQATVDREDRNSFERLNQTRFYNYRLNLEGLL